MLVEAELPIDLLFSFFFISLSIEIAPMENRHGSPLLKGGYDDQECLKCYGHQEWLEQRHDSHGWASPDGL